MPTELVSVLGAGGHGRVVVDALQMLGYSSALIVIRDDKPDFSPNTLMGCTVEAPIIPTDGLDGWVHAAVGSAIDREGLLQRSGISIERWLTIIHPSAAVARSATLCSGSFVAAQAVVAPCARIDVGVIVNHGAIVDHDCHVGAYTHIAPAASLGGGVHVGERVFVGAGARILPGIRIGDDAVIGAGAVVLTEVPAGQTWIGVPAIPAN